MKTPRTSIAATIFFIASTALLAQTGAVAVPQAASAEAAVPVEAHGGVRIVRLSEVKGEVLLDRNVDHGFESAFANIPITQGARLKTGTGVAEVEFEDNSTLRLTPDTTIEFTQLWRGPSGATTSSVRVVEGTLFVSLAPTKGDEFSITSNEGKLVLAPSTRIHFHVGAPKTTLAVLDGSVQVQAGANSTTAVKKTTLLFDPANQAAPTLVSHLDKSPYDQWDKNSVDYHKRAMNYSSFGSTGAGFGLNDMNYYGSFTDIGGCGSMWRPYLASAAFDPYANGVLAYYPSMGYSWVSPYPWGWTAFHSGNWVNCGGAGWGWQPGGNFSGLTNLTSAVTQKHGVLVPPRPPARGHGTLLVVSKQPIASSGFADHNTFVFTKDSAGFGVPRQTFGKLDGVSRGALQHGAVSTAAFSAPVSLGSQPGARSVSFVRAGVSPGTPLTGSSMSADSSARGGISSGSSAGIRGGSAVSSGAAMSSGASHGGSMGGGGGGGASHH